MDALKIGELFSKLKPRIIDLISIVGGGTGPFAPSPHDLNSAHHTGTIADAQATQFLKTDGTRQLTGNMAVANGITIDGVDISAHAGSVSAHHEPVTIADSSTIDLSLSGQQLSASVIQSGLDHGSIGGLSDDDHPHYYNATRHSLALHTGLGLVPDSRSLLAGDGLSGGGDLSADRTLAVGAGTGISVGADDVGIDLAANLTWGGNHVFQGGLSTRHLLPELTDTYDLGSPTLIWRKGWLSELESVVFAENSISAIGGWFMVTKGQGSFVTDILSTDTQIDFGQTMTPDDFVIIRSSDEIAGVPKTEYMQVGTLVSGTTYNVTRGVGGISAKDWAAGTVYVVLGNSGDGRIELQGGDTPRLSMILQGATYNGQTEYVRIGDLNGMPGFVSETYGIYIGDESNYLKFSGGSLVIAGNGSGITNIDGGNITASTITGTQLSADSIDGKTITGSILRTSASGARTEINHTNLFGLGFGGIGGTDGTTTQWYAKASDGKIYAGQGKVKIDSNGIGIIPFYDGYADNTAIKWASTISGSYDAVRLDVTQRDTGDITDLSTLNIKAGAVGDSYGSIALQAVAVNAASDTGVELSISGKSGVTIGRFGSTSGSSLWVKGSVTIVGSGNKYISFLDGNINAEGDIGYDGNLISRKNSTTYQGYIYIPLTSPLTSTAWDGDARSTKSKTLIDLSAVFGVPAGVKAVNIKVSMRDSGSAAGNGGIVLGPNATAWEGKGAQVSGIRNDAIMDFDLTVPCDVNGDIYYQTFASGTNTLDVWLQIWGYWI